MTHFQHLMATATTIVTLASGAANLLPKSTIFANHPVVKRRYEVVVSIIAVLALNLRICLPALGIRIPGIGFNHYDE